MSRSSNHHASLFRLWWRRQSFFLRHSPLKWLVFVCICFLYLLTILPNPFSSGYSSISVVQDAPWESIEGLLKTKETLYETDRLSREVKYLHPGSTKKHFPKPILILLYTTIFLNKKYCRLSVEKIFGETCPSKNQCQWTCDQRQLSEADAVIIHAPDVQYYQAAIPSRSQAKRDSIWILWSDEPPSLVDYSYFKAHQFNWTISYKLTSEVSIGAYGLFTKRTRPLSDREYYQWIEKQFSKRIHGALWFVSNCKSKRRLEYFHQLRRDKSLQVEGYGRCVDSYPMHFCTASTQCEADYMSKYKYYLSFESTTCRDYITEKFYKAFYHGLIPIIHGPDRKDYENLAPSNSFIHLNDFDGDLHRLGTYLQSIQANFSLYSMYHQWRKTSEVIIDGKALERIRMCELCERLTRLRENEVVYYTDIERFFRERCSLLK